MRKHTHYLYVLIAFAVFVSCGQSTKNTTRSSATAEASAESSISSPGFSEKEISNPNISVADIKATVSYLASDELEGRETGTEGIEKAASYIEDIFSKHNIQPYFSSYRDNFEVNGRQAFNVVGYIEGNDPALKDEFIILGAHYDHVGTDDAVNDDSIANGANDNATGTAAVIEAAKYFSKQKNNKRSILFALFSAEEMGLKGSEHLAKKLKNEGLDLYAMLNIEMIGIPMENRSYEAYLTGFKRSNFAQKFNEYAGDEVFGWLPEATQYKLFQRSDNYPFFKEFNVPAQTLSTFDFKNYDFYHHVSDEAELMDYEHMADLIEIIIPGIVGMANTREQEIKMN